MKKSVVALVTVSLACLGSVASAQAATLYSGAGLPSAEGWVYQALVGVPTPPFVSPWAGASQTVTSSGVRLSTLSTEAGLAGYSRQLPAGSLNRTAGFRLSFTTRLIAETHADASRAGLSVTVLTTDNRGIEFGFHPGAVFPQAVGFTAEASANVDTSVLRTYDLDISGGAFALSTGGLPLLAGSLRQYTTAGPFAPVYQSTDFIAISDNTSRASADFVLANVTLIPEPGLLATFAPAGVLLLRRRR